MWSHYLLTLYRSLTRRRLYAALNIVGLAVGTAVFLVLTLLVRFEVTFDRWLPNADLIYRFNATYTFPGRPAESMALTSPAILPVLLSDYPQIVGGTRVLSRREPVAVASLTENESVSYVDPGFFKVLPLPLVAGDLASALASPDRVVISQAMARKYFGAISVIGRTLTIDYRGQPQAYRVSGVLKDLPANSHLSLEILAPFNATVLRDPRVGLDQWGAPSGWTYVRFADRAAASAVAADLARFLERRGHDDTLGGALPQILHLSLTAIPALHFADANLEMSAKPGVDRRLVYSLGLVGLLTLLIAVTNYVNLATAQAALRAKEVALRKVMGATRLVLIFQLVAEAVAMAALASVCGVALTELAIPSVNALGGASLKLIYFGVGGALAWLPALALTVGLVAGAYPALVLSRFEPAPVLAAARSPGGGEWEARVRATLIGVQFVVAITFTICAMVIAAQAHFLHVMDRGFRPQGLLLVDSFQSRELGPIKASLLDALRRTPGVTAVTTSIEEPGLGQEGLAQVRRPGQKAPITIDQDIIGDDYLATYGSRLVAGRMLDRSHGLDDIGDPDRAPANGGGLMLNVRATQLLGFSEPAAAVGQWIEQDGVSSLVVGVLDDIHFASPQRPVAGIVYRYSRRPGFTAAVRYSGANEADIRSRLGAVWRQLAPAIPFEAKTAEQGLRGFYVADEQRARLFTIGSILAVGIGCTGLYGLAAFNTARRFKEIGIRKTLGASAADVLKLLLVQTLRPVLIANLIAWPLAYFAMRAWLASFDQRIALSPLFFLAASGLALTTAGLTVISQARRLAQSEPAKALRHE